MKNKNNGDEGIDAIKLLERKAAEELDRDMNEYDIQGSVSLDGKIGVHQRVITTILKDGEYRQLLLMAAFDNKQEAMLAADAITERLRYGVDIAPICDRVVAQCAVKSAQVKLVLDSMNSYTLRTNYGGKVPEWKRKQDNKSIG